MSRLAPKLVLLLGSIALALASTEVALRLIGYEYRPMQIATGSRSDAREYHLFGDENFVFDSELIWRPKAGFGVFNSLGFRGPEVGAKNGSLRIATVGDSNTLGWSGVDGANWPADLEQRLASGGVENEVINAGVWGYSSHQGVPRVRQVLELEPDIVLISFGSNDAHQVSRSDAEFSRRTQGRLRVSRALQGLRVAQLTRSVLDRSDSGDLALEPRVDGEAYEENLRLMVEEARVAGAVPVLLTRPFYGTVSNPQTWKHRGPDYNAATARVAASLDVLVIDVHAFFKERDELFADESHFTEEGHQIAAAVVYEHLRHLAAAHAAGHALVAAPPRSGYDPDR